MFGKKRWVGVLVMVSLVVTMLVPVVAFAGRPIGSSVQVIGDPEVEVSPSIAYNSQREQYLVVWYNDRPGNDDIRAQRVSKDGTLVGGPFYISAGTGAERRFPDVAYNSAADQYLVVWEHEDSWGLVGVHGRRVSGSGQVLDANDIEIRSTGSLYTPAKPAVAYASTSNRYLVVWAETWHPLPISHEILGQMVTSAGAPDGGRFTITSATGSEPLDEPDLAYNRHANRYLVVWQKKDKTSSLWDIHGQQVHGGGGLYQGDIAIAYYTISSTAPAVAAIPTTPSADKFLVVWEANLSGHRDIYGQVLAEDGTLAPTALLIAWTGVDQSSPAVAGAEGGDRYLVTWRHPLGVVDVPIHGRSIAYDGAFQDEFELGAPAADSSAVAAGPSGDFMIAWQDQPVFATDSNIYGQLWGNRVYLPLLLRNAH